MVLLNKSVDLLPWTRSKEAIAFLQHWTFGSKLALVRSRHGSLTYKNQNSFKIVTGDEEKGGYRLSMDSQCNSCLVVASKKKKKKSITMSHLKVHYTCFRKVKSTFLTSNGIHIIYWMDESNNKIHSIRNLSGRSDDCGGDISKMLDLKTCLDVILHLDDTF